MSGRELEAPDAAFSMEYYESSRTASHEDVANALNSARSTTVEQLRRAESTLLQTFLGD